MNGRLWRMAGVLVLVAMPAPSMGARADGEASVLVTAVYADPFVAGEGSEAVQIQNVGGEPVTIEGWTIADGEGAAEFPSGAELAAGEKIWVSKEADAFLGEFGFLPEYEFGTDTDASVPNMSGTAIALGNGGDEVVLRDEMGDVADAMMYGDANLVAQDWSGAGVRPYIVGGIGAEGQILYRKQQESDGMPVSDTNTAKDWAQDERDARFGKKVKYAGWAEDEFFQTAKSKVSATVKYCVAPDNLYECVRQEIVSATRTVSMEMYSLDSASMVDVITGKLDEGVRVSILLDGAAMETQGKWACAEIEEHGGECWLIASKPQANLHKRYDSQHGKWMIVDGARALIGSENVGVDAMPADMKADGTFGTRGGFVITDNAELVNAARKVIEADFDPPRHTDIRRWGTNTDDYAPIGFAPNYMDGGHEYAVQFPTPFEESGTFATEMMVCPDNCLRVSDGLLGMVAKAGVGDELLVEQLYENPFWGSGASNAVEDPNLRLEAYIAAARRGANVRILLDSYYDVFSEAKSNYAACVYMNSFQNLYDIECRLANPTGKGIHMKMVLLEKSETGWVHLGSINGSETSNKLNREMAVQVESLAAERYWRNVFLYDWGTTKFAPHRLFLPMLKFRRH